MRLVEGSGTSVISTGKASLIPMPLYCVFIQMRLSHADSRACTGFNQAR
jgi:hypothetical protein